MNIIVNSQLLVAELRLVNKVVPNKPALAILSHVLLTANVKTDVTAEGESLRFWATDLEGGLSCSCVARVDEPGIVALPAAKLLSLVEQFADGDVTIKVEKGHATVQCGAFKTRLQALPADDFPSLPTVEGQSSTIDGDAFRQLIERTRYAVDSTANKYVMKGALLTLAGPAAVMAATDSKRLALATAMRSGPDTQFIVPVKALDMLTTHLDGPCEVTLGVQHIFFTAGGRLLTTRMINGKFPAYERIVPRSNNLVVTLDRLALTAALRRITLVSEESGAVNMDLSTNQLVLSSSSVAVGSADEVLHVLYEGDSMRVCINGHYMLDFLSAASGASINLKLKDSLSAALFEDGDSYITVIMPMKG